MPAGPRRPPECRIVAADLLAIRSSLPFPARTGSGNSGNADSVDRHTAFETDSHPAQGTARLSGDRSSARLSSDSIATATVVPGGTETRCAIYRQCEQVRHARAPWLLARANRLNWNLRIRARDLIHQNSAVANEVVIPKPSCPVARNRIVTRPRSDQGQLVGSGGAKACPRADRGHLSQPWHVFLRALQHSRQSFRGPLPCARSILPRRTDQNLAGAPRLHVECNRIAGYRVRALQVTKFHQLMPQKSRITIGDDEMAFSLLDLDARREVGATGLRPHSR